MKDFNMIGIMAQDKDGLIGLENDLPWKNDSDTKWDMKHFKEVTTGFPIIMGFKTFVSLGSPLKNRINFIIDSHNTVEGPNIVSITQDHIPETFDDTKFYAVQNIYLIKNIIKTYIKTEKAFLIGGAKTIVRAILDKELDKFILTTFNKSYFNGSDDVVYLDFEGIDYKITDTIIKENGKIEYLEFEE